MSPHWGKTNAGDTDENAQDDFLVTSSSGNHGLACSDAMKRYSYHLNALWTPTPSCQPNRYGLKGSIIVPSNVSLAKRKRLELVRANFCFTPSIRFFFYPEHPILFYPEHPILFHRRGPTWSFTAPTVFRLSCMEGDCPQLILIFNITQIFYSYLTIHGTVFVQTWTELFDVSMDIYGDKDSASVMSPSTFLEKKICVLWTVWSPNNVQFQPLLAGVTLPIVSFVINTERRTTAKIL